MHTKSNLTTRDYQRLTRVHPGIITVLEYASCITPVPFMVVEGLRTLETQKRYVAEGKSKTMNSKHLPQKDGYSHAVDLCGIVKATSFTVPVLRAIADVVKDAANKLDVAIVWGGDWKSFRDMPHFELLRA